MESQNNFESVWDALEDNDVRAQNMKLRSTILMSITRHIQNVKASEGLTQSRLAQHLGINQPRVSALLNGKIDEFRLDTLVDIANRLGLHVCLEVAA